jgi:CMP-N,N'-diacetyllegionaminic acid synthase
MLVVIPARGGSKGVPGKNIKILGGKPLIQYTIDAARAVFDDSVICVSTDNIETKYLVEEMGLKVPFIRPDFLATDTAGTNEVLLHAIEFYENLGYFSDTLILLQPTSPFRNAHHIKEALELYDENCEMVVSVNETKSNPYFSLKEENEQGFLIKSKEGNFKRRQDCPRVYELNGAIYIISIESLKKNPIQDFKRVKKFLMSDIDSIDIDTDTDFHLAEILI